MGKFIQIYEKNHVKKDDERLGLFEVLNAEYTIKKVLYPGSYAHITPSFVFSDVIYNDTYKKLEPYYKSTEIYTYIQKHKQYEKEPQYDYIQKNYNQALPLDDAIFDLLISQYAGFISRACMRYLKIGGILVANTSHGDVSMASILPEYKFIAVIHRRGDKFTHSTKNLESYLIPKKPQKTTEEILEKLGRSIGYTKYATDYVFKRIK